MKFIVEIPNEHEYAEDDMAGVVESALDDYGIHAKVTVVTEE